jgi:glycosyltransferase involved in cell wall biosynthesis
MLAQELSRDHEVLVVNFKRLYPSFLFPGRTQLDESGEPLAVASVRLIDSLNPLSFWVAARAIRSFRPNVIVFQWWHPFFAVAYAAMVRFLGSTLRRKVVFLCHNVLPHERSAIDTLLIRLGFAQVQRFLVQSREDGRNLQALKKSAVVEVHPHPIYSAFKRGRHTRDTARKEMRLEGRVVLFFGLIRPYKGLGILIEAFARSASQLGATLLIVGEFYEKKEPHVMRIRQLGIEDRVRIVDRYVPNEEVEKYFVACDLVVLPYLSATQSGITQIAFAFDKPVVVTRVGGLPDVVDDGVTGYVVQPNDPQSLADAMIRFFTLDVGGRMAQAVSGARERFSWARCAHVLVELVDAPLPG